MMTIQLWFYLVPFAFPMKDQLLDALHIQRLQVSIIGATALGSESSIRIKRQNRWCFLLSERISRPTVARCSEEVERSRRKE